MPGVLNLHFILSTKTVSGDTQNVSRLGRFHKRSYLEVLGNMAALKFLKHSFSEILRHNRMFF